MTNKDQHIRLKLDRPLAFFDIESTGTSPRGDRIIDMAITKIFPDGERRTYTYRVNPEMPIPEGSTRIHGITDDDVRESPTFKEIAEKVCELLDDSDLAGYNIVRFDVPMLQEEFKRAGVTFDTESRRMIDVQRIFHRKEPRDLSAALSFYCGEMHMGAHGAEDDVLATIRVLEGQYDKYNDLPTDPDALHDYCNPKDPDWVDRTGRQVPPRPRDPLVRSRRHADSVAADARRSRRAHLLQPVCRAANLRRRAAAWRLLRHKVRPHGLYSTPLNRCNR